MDDSAACLLIGSDMIGDSATARMFDASITVAHGAGAERGLYLVVGRDRTPAEVVLSLGGEIVLHFPETRKVLALLPIRAQTAMQRNPGIVLAGRVSIDSERFAGFVAFAGLDAARGAHHNPR